MKVTSRLAIFAAGLVAVFALAAGVGSLVEPADTDGSDAYGGESAHADAARGHEEADGHGGHGKGQQEPAGLAVAADGYSLQLEPTFFAQGQTQELRFSIAGADGDPVTAFDELHERRMHLIVVGRDGSAFRHLHPEMDATGDWRQELAFESAGVYRVFADFSVGGEQHTLAGDVFVSGDGFDPQPFPAPSPVDSTGAYEVRLETGGDVVAGKPASLTFSVAQGGHEVHELDPYLGARGHLVALRAGDLAYLHVHPEHVDVALDPGMRDQLRHEAGGGDGHGDAAGKVAFAATFPTAGRYRLYLQFKHEGVVRTAEFTVEVTR